MENKKTLVCVICQTRAYEISWDSFRDNLCGSIDDKNNVDILICIGIDDFSSYNFENGFWKYAKYRFVYNEIEEYSSTIYEISKQLSNNIEFPSELLGFKGNLLGGIKHENVQGSGLIILYFKWLLFKNLQKHNLIEKYDKFVITRSDYVYEAPHPPIDLLSEDKIWVVDGQFYGGVCDRHTILSKKYLSLYLLALESLIRNDLRYQNIFSRDEFVNLEKFYYFYLKEFVGLDNISKIPNIMYTARGDNDKTTSVLGVFSSSKGHFIKNPEEYIDAQRAKRIFHDRLDWENYFFTNLANLRFCNKTYSQDVWTIFTEDRCYKINYNNHYFLEKDSLLDDSDRKLFFDIKNNQALPWLASASINDNPTENDEILNHCFVMEIIEYSLYSFTVKLKFKERYLSFDDTYKLSFNETKDYASIFRIVKRSRRISD